MARLLSILLAIIAPLGAENYSPSREIPPPLTREFRGAWIAIVHNIDWPSKKGLTAAAQQDELRHMLDKLAALHINAVMFQVRPECDAAYHSPHEPWSQWLTGTMGKHPGYDPLAFCIREAHARGIEVHAWFNPFRALSHTSHLAASSHITRSDPHLTKRYGSLVWCDPSMDAARARAMIAILDVAQRYDVDGIHLDDYFYPYPKPRLSFADDKSPAQRRAFIDSFVQSLYANVKSTKPWVRVGISPFGIWRPGIPEGIEAGIDSYEDLAGDSRKWLASGWVDYLAPQLYWRIEPKKQSFPLLLEWWRGQGQRPVWPGIATARIQSDEDPGRPASEITRQISHTREIKSSWHGHLHWSAKALVTNRGGIATQLAASYRDASAVPPMPWISQSLPATPGLAATKDDKQTHLRWRTDGRTARIAVQAKSNGTWRTLRIIPASEGLASIPPAEAVAVTALDRFGNASPPKVVGLN